MPVLSRRDAMKIGGAAAGAMMLPQVRSASAQDAVTIKFWNSIYSLEDPNDKTRDPKTFYINQAIERFQAANPGVTVEMEIVPGDTTMFTKFRTASVAQNGPDVMTLWSGTYMLNLSDFIEPLGPYFTAEERARIIGWEVVSPEFDAESPNIFGVPAGSDGRTTLFYNADVLTAAGIDPAAGWPTDFDSFITFLDAIKATGVTPIAFDQYGYVWHVLFYWIAQNIGGAVGLGELAAGTRKFSDPVLVNIVENWLKLADYSIEGTPTMEGSQALQLLFTGEAAMTSAGIWILADSRTALGDKLGMVNIPNFNSDAGILNGGIGGAGTCLVVSNYSEVKEQSVAFLKFLMSADEQIAKAQSGQGSLINVTDVDAAQYYEDPLKKQQQEWAVDPNTIFWADNTLQADLTTEITAQAQLAWEGGLSAAEFMQALDDKRDSLIG